MLGILIVEDNKEIGELLQTLLRKNNYVDLSLLMRPISIINVLV